MQRSGIHADRDMQRSGMRVMWSRVGELRGHRGAVQCLAAEAEVLASGGEDGTVRLWDVAAGRSTRALLSPAGLGVNAVCIGRGECANFVLGAAGREVFAYDVRAPGLVLRQPDVPSLGRCCDEVSALALNDSGTHAAIGDDSGAVRLVDLDGEEQPPAPQESHGSICSCVAFRPGAALELISGGMDMHVVRWDGSSGSAIGSVSVAQASLPGEAPPAQLVNPRHVHSLAYAPGGFAYALALGDGSLEIRSAAEGDLIACASEAHRAAASQVLFAPELAHLLPPRGAPGGGGGAVAGGRGAAAGMPLISAGDDAVLCLWAAEVHAGGGTRLREVSRVQLGEKPNWIALSRGVVCVAGMSDRVGLYRLDPLAAEFDLMDLS